MVDLKFFILKFFNIGKLKSDICSGLLSFGFSTVGL